jgi:hypothetical protein
MQQCSIVLLLSKKQNQFDSSYVNLYERRKYVRAMCVLQSGQ